MGDVLLLTRSDIERLITLDDCIGAVEKAFRAHAEGRSLSPALMHVEALGGEFHVKGGGLALGERSYFALKANGGFFQNRARFGLPNIVGVIYLADATNGVPLAVMDSSGITIMRTGAATAVAARHCARADARVATMCGTGRQGRIQLRALNKVRPLERAFAWSPTSASMQTFADEMSAELGIVVEPAKELANAVRKSDIIVTCTPAHAPFVEAGWLQPGSFLAAVGADSPDKQELHATVLRGVTIVTDLTEQAAAVGELHHAIEAGIVSRDDVYAELGEIAAGRRAGRRRDDEIVVFDSTGTALQDVAAAALALDRAKALGVGTTFDFSA